MEGMEAARVRSEVPLFDNRAQIALAQFVYKREHPEVQVPSHKDIMLHWLAQYAAEYRKIADENPDEKVNVTDEGALAGYYKRILEAHDENTSTAH